MSKATKLYPIRGRWLHDHPTAVHVVETKAEADELIESGAFTDNANHPDRDHEAVDLTATPQPLAEVPAADQPIAESPTVEG